MSGYVIRSGDLYWRPNGCGYTAQLWEAGIFSEADAKRAENCRRSPLDKAIPITVEMVSELMVLRNDMDAAIEQFRAALPCAFCRRRDDPENAA